MKIFGVLLLMIGMLFSGDRPCPHALGMQMAHGEGHHMSEDHCAHMTHAGMDHGAGHGEHSAPDPSDRHCPDDCEGGNDCSGCSALSATLVAKAAMVASPVFDSNYSLIVSDRMAVTSGLELPPPKFISLI